MRQEEHRGRHHETRGGGRPSPPWGRADARSEEHGCQPEIDGGTRLEHGLGAEERQEDEAGHDAPDDGPHGVGPVKTSDLPPDVRPVPRDHGHGAREGRPDEKRGEQEGTRADGELHELDELWSRRPPQADEEHLRSPFEEEDGRAGRHSDPGLKQCEGCGRGLSLRRQARVKRAPAGDPHQEGQEHRGEGIGRAAYRERQGTGPPDLVEH